MEFTFETQYNAKAMADMAKALRKTIRKQHSRRSHIFGWTITVFGFLFVIFDFALDFRTIITAAVVLLVLLTLLFEDKLNAYVAKKRMLPGTENTIAVFSENGFTSTTDAGTTEWHYDKIMMIAETDHFFVFIYSQHHAQVYDKRHLQGGTADDFRRFIEAATKKQIQKV